MIHADDSGGLQIKQVEMNTIATGAAGLASANTKLHRYFAFPTSMTCRHLMTIGAYGRTTHINEHNLPNNPAVEHLAAGFARAHEKY
jgi:hypothetical protein